MALRVRVVCANSPLLASAAGYTAIFVSVDLPVLGTRPNETRNKFAFPSYVDFPNLKHLSEEGESEVTAEGLLDYGTCASSERTILPQAEGREADCYS